MKCEVCGAELNDNAHTLFAAVDIHHVFESKWFEIEFIAGIVVGGNGSRVGVDHNGHESGLAQCE